MGKTRKRYLKLNDFVRPNKSQLRTKRSNFLDSIANALKSEIPLHITKGQNNLEFVRTLTMNSINVSNGRITFAKPLRYTPYPAVIKFGNGLNLNRGCYGTYPCYTWRARDSVQRIKLSLEVSHIHLL
jgi:hypothetical protein